VTLLARALPILPCAHPSPTRSESKICDCEKRSAGFDHYPAREIAPPGGHHLALRLRPPMCELAHHLLTQKTCALASPTAWPQPQVDWLLPVRVEPVPLQSPVRYTLLRLENSPLAQLAPV